MTDTNTQPLFKHDCNKCSFLGYYTLGGISYDLYYCDQHGLPTVIARYGNSGPEYYSGMEVAHKHGLPQLYEAKKRAIAQGIYTDGKN